MPVVQYTPDQVRTEVAGRAQAGTMPSGTGQLAQGISTAAGVIIQQQQKANIAEAQQASTSFERDKNDLFFNPDTGYFNTQGRNAYESAGSVSQQLDKLKKQYSTDLSPEARREFERVASAQITRSNADIMRHSSKNLQAWEQANTAAEIENTLENSALYWNRPDDLKIQRALGEQSVLEVAQAQGLSPEATNEKLETYRSAFASNIIKSATSSSAAEGRDAMEKYGNRLEGPAKVNMQMAIDKRTQTERTQEISQQAVLTGTTLVRDYGEHPNARNVIMEEVNKIEDADLRKATMSQANHQLSIKKQADAEMQGEIFKEAERAKFDANTSVERFKADNPEHWDKLTAKQQQSLASNSKTTTDYVLFSELSLMDEKELAKVNPSDYITQLASTEYKQLVTMVKSARDVGTDSGNQAGRGRTAQTSSSVEQLFGKKSSWDTNEIEQVNAFYSVLDGEVKMQEQLKGSSLTSQEYTAVLDGFTRKYVIEGGAWFGLADADKDLTDISADELIDAAEYLRSRGEAATTESLYSAQEGLRLSAGYLKKNDIPVTVENIQTLYDQARR